MSEVDTDIMNNIKIVLNRIEQACLARSKALPQITPRLVCVSKTKPVSDIIEAYDAGQRHFGENYANELNEKALNDDIINKCKDIKWHYIGHLQTNKINKVLACPGLYMIETVDSQKLAENLNKQWMKYKKDDERLNVMVQINSSGEDVKNGVDASEATDLVTFIKDNCPNLNVKGIMTIGMYGFDCSNGPNPDFVTLVKCREAVCEELGMNIADFELSMGMSSDFEHAIELGSTNVRVGSTIFGERIKKVK